MIEVDKQYLERLERVIPGGAHTYSRGSDQYSSNAPKILRKGKGAYVFDSNGDKYLDYGMALRSVILGYSYAEVDRAAIDEINNGNNLSKPSFIELEAAEKLIELIPSIEMVKFAKNGSSVTTAACKLARVYTGKKYICIPQQQPFFSYDDWFIGNSVVNKGVPSEYASNILKFDFNNIQSLEKLFNLYGENIAAVMMEPATHLLPCSLNCNINNFNPDSCSNCNFKSQNFLNQVANLCKRNGSIFILDEMRTGFRWNKLGAQHIFKVKPDLTTFGKAIANGFSVAVLGGKKEILEVASTNKIGRERTFLLSSTHGAEMSSLGALKKTLEIIFRENVSDYIWQFGNKLVSSVVEVTNSLDLSENFKLVGPSVALEIECYDNDLKNSLQFKTLFLQEMCKNKILIGSGNSFAQSYSHGEKEFQKTEEAIYKSLMVFKNALNFGISKYLDGEPVKPVFRRFN